MNTRPTRQPAGAGVCLSFLAGMAVTAVCAALAVVPRPAAAPAETAPRPAVPAPQPVPPAGYLVNSIEGGPAAG
jgi:hypothetical protein